MQSRPVDWPQLRAGYLPNKSRSTIWRWERKGIWPPKIRIAPNSVVWLSHEIDAVMAARITGASDEDVRGLVKRLIEDRATAGTEVA